MFLQDFYYDLNVRELLVRPVWIS